MFPCLSEAQKVTRHETAHLFDRSHTSCNNCCSMCVIQFMYGSADAPASHAMDSIHGENATEVQTKSQRPSPSQTCPSEQTQSLNANEPLQGNATIQMNAKTQSEGLLTSTLPTREHKQKFHRGITECTDDNFALEVKKPLNA